MILSILVVFTILYFAVKRNWTLNFKNIDSSDLLVSAVEKKLLKLDKLFDKPAEARVAFSAEKDKYKEELQTCEQNLENEEEAKNKVKGKNKI